MINLKKWTKIALIATFSVTMLSCTEEEGPESPQLGTSTLEKASEYDNAVKYYIRYSDAEYSSVEFTEGGQYIIIRNPYFNDNPYYAKQRGSEPKNITYREKLLNTLYRPLSNTRSGGYKYQINGNYEDLGNGHYKLDGFGTVEVTGDDDNTLSIIITPDGGEPTVLECIKSDRISDTEATRWLCRTWTLGDVEISASVNGRSVFKESAPASTGLLSLNVKAMNAILNEIAKQYGFEDDDYLSDSDLREMGVVNVDELTFSRAGTYLINSKSEDLLGISMWTWKNESKGIIRYSHQYDSFDNPALSNDILVSFSGNTATIQEDKETVIPIGYDEDDEDDYDYYRSRGTNKYIKFNISTRYTCFDKK